ncbi:MAG: lactate utilization protein [Ruthenibacterium sp.]
MSINEAVSRTMAALEKNNMLPHFVQTAAEVVPLLETLLHSGDTVGVGGSMTLEACGVLPHLRSGRYRFLDRYAAGLSGDDIGKIYRDCFFADAYLTSTNALTEDGALVNMDGNANRVAAMSFGPKQVIVVAGINKIVPDEAAAKVRIETIAAPLNAKRLSCKTPCAVTGQCEHCSGPARICCTYMVQRQQRAAGRIHVIVVNEPLGY